MSKLPETGPSLRRYLERAQRQAIRESNASPYTRSGISVTAEDEVTVDGSLIVTGPMAVGGTLSLPAGIIDNDALANPVVFDAGYANADGFTTSTTAADLASFTVAVPAGFTQAVVQASAMIFVYNGTATYSYLRDRIYVDRVGQTSQYSRLLLTALPAPGSASSAMIDSFRFTGLSGGVLTIRLSVSTDYTAITHASNGATVSAVVTFLR